MTQLAKPLEGVRVLDFGHTIMGPCAGVVFADLGADVVKIEPVDGDPTRRLPGFAAGFSTNDVSALAARLTSKGVRFTDEHGQLFIAPDQTPGLRMVVSQDVARPMIGRVRCELGRLTGDDAEFEAGLRILRELGDQPQIAKFEG